MGRLDFRTALRLARLGARHGRADRMVNRGLARLEGAEVRNEAITEELLRGDPRSFRRYMVIDETDRTAVKMTFVLIGIGFLAGVAFAAASRGSRRGGGGPDFSSEYPPEW